MDSESEAVRKEEERLLRSINSKKTLSHSNSSPISSIAKTSTPPETQDSSKTVLSSPSSTTTSSSNQAASEDVHRLSSSVQDLDVSATSQPQGKSWRDQQKDNERRLQEKVEITTQENNINQAPLPRSSSSPVVSKDASNLVQFTSTSSPMKSSSPSFSSDRITNLIPLISAPSNKPLHISESANQLSIIARGLIQIVLKSYDHDAFLSFSESLIELVRGVGDGVSKDHQDSRAQLFDAAKSFLLSSSSFIQSQNISDPNAQSKFLVDLSSLIRAFQPCFDATSVHCSTCSQVIDHDFVKSGEKSFHPECLMCFKCKIPLTAFFVADEHYFCDADYKTYMIETKKAVICRACKKIVEGQFMTYDDLSYHQDCFKCSKCEQPITGNFFEVEEEESSQTSMILCADCTPVQ